jgi:23S rRNA (cytosine1962-C5)-methyltransferase
LRSGHPWVFADKIADQNRPGEIGELAIIYDRKDQFLAAGLYDPDSPIRVRVLHRGKPTTIDDAWWRERFERALEKRLALFDARTTGYRWINGESDGWPGLVLDRYGDSLVVKLYTAAWLPRMEEVASLFAELLNPQRIVLRLSRNIQTLAAECFSRKDGSTLHGEPPPGPVLFLESGLRFEAEILRGQKTGFFLDQRENRRRVGALSKGGAVLNVFSFSGGFSLYAAQGGAASVTDVDISAYALESGARNFALNQNLPAVAACRRAAVQADAFEWLAGKPARQFDVIVLDPPSLARREADRPAALAAYAKLAAAAVPHLAARGVLVACSCSAHVGREEFFQTVRAAVSSRGRQFQELDRTGPALDHPATIPEADYLKAIYLRSR